VGGGKRRERDGKWVCVPKGTAVSLSEESPVPFGVRIHFFSSSTKGKAEGKIAGYPGCLRIDGKCTYGVTSSRSEERSS